MARRAKLPQKIIDFIPEHHGTGLIRFFYLQALKQYEEKRDGRPACAKRIFAIPGPPAPFDRDGDRDAFGFGSKPSPPAGSRVCQVNESETAPAWCKMAISERFDDGQFDECDLTFAQLNTIREALVETLMARYHFRVAYPSMPKRETAPAASREMGPIPVVPVGSSGN